MKLNGKVQKVVDMVKADKGLLKTNCQRALITLLTAKDPSGWVARESVKIPSATARLRELRSDRFGFRVEVRKDKPTRKGDRMTQQTFYRLDPKTVTASRVRMALVGGDA